MANRRSHKNLVIGLLLLFALLIGIVYALWVAVVTVGAWIAGLESEVAAALIAGVGTFAAGVIAVVLSQQIAKSREIAEAHRPKKIDLYTRFITKVMQYLQKEKEEPAGGDDELPISNDERKFFVDFHTDLVVWGSPRVIRAYERFRKESLGKQTGQIVLVMDDVMRAMRHDLGHRDWTMQRGDLIKVFLKSRDDDDQVDRVRSA